MFTNMFNSNCLYWNVREQFFWVRSYLHHQTHMEISISFIIAIYYSNFGELGSRLEVHP